MSDEKIKGYWVNPDQGNGKSLLVLHAWWGLNETIKGFCKQLGDEGYLVFAPDLYGGKVTDTIPMAEKLSNDLFLDYEGAAEHVRRAAQALLHEMEQPGKGMGVIGFSLGTPFGLELSVKMPEVVKSVVVFYGS